MDLQRASCLAASAVILTAATALAGCGSPGPYGGAPPYNGPHGSGTVDCSKDLPPAGTEVIYLFLSGPHCNDSTYGDIDGYYFDSTFQHFEIIKITASPTNSVIFQNVDQQDHFTSSLGPWTGSWPSTGPTPTGTPSPQGTDIGSTGWTTGLLAPGQESHAYIANMPGMYVIGDAGGPSPYFYFSNHMRTVIIVHP